MSSYKCFDRDKPNQSPSSRAFLRRFSENRSIDRSVFNKPCDVYSQGKGVFFTWLNKADLIYSPLLAIYRKDKLLMFDSLEKHHY